MIYLGGYIARRSMHVRSHLIIHSTPGTNYLLCCNVFNTQFSLTNQPFCTQVYVSHIRTSNTDANKSSTVYIVVLYKVSSAMLIQMFYSRNSQCMRRSLRSFYVIWCFHNIRVNLTWVRQICMIMHIGR